MFVPLYHAWRAIAHRPALRAIATVAAAALTALAITPGAHALQPTAQTGEVDITLEQFGAGGVARPGEWAGVRLLLRDRGDRVRNVVVQLEVPDPDGDTAVHQRIVALNPGVESGQGVWMYPRLPFSFTPSSRLTITVREAAEDDAPDRLAQGRRLGAATVQAQRLVNSVEPLAAVLGVRQMGLEQYSFTPPTAREQPATTNELMQTARGLAPASLPDAWMGLWQFETIVWGDGDPAALRAGGADALADWIRRGGHLVVVLPSIGSTWTDPLANPLYDLMPRVRVRRLEGVPLEPYREMLTRDEALPLPGRAIVHAFAPTADADAAEAAPILRGENGEVVVVQRRVGIGAVTLVGVDLAATGLLGRIDADVFWHRVLGKRGDLFTVAELQEQRTATGETINIRRFGDMERLDAAIGAAINKTGRAGVGVLLGLIVFTAYVLLAGPVGFALLSRIGWRRHAWAAFVGTTALFTVIAWGGARAIRPARTEITHLSLLDHVYGQELQRARSWMSALVPEYGDATFAFADEAASRIAGVSALSPWDDPESTLSGMFPDARPYAIDTRRPARIREPSRATVKRLQADWAGPPVLPMPQPVGQPVRIDESGRLRGALQHGTPQPLTRVRVILARGQTPLGVRRRGGPLLAITRAWDPFPGGWWAPGETLNLETLDAGAREGGAGARLQTAEDYFSAVGAGGGQAGGAIDLRSAPRRLEALAWAPLLEPPDWRSSAPLSRAPLMQRRAGQRMDLARWFTQPCLIIVGQMEEAPMPAAVTINGQTPPSSGRTIVRWVYPLAPDPPGYLNAGTP